MESASESLKFQGVTSSNPIAGAANQDLMTRLRHKVHRDIAEDDIVKTVLECLLIDTEALISQAGDDRDFSDDADIIDGDGIVVPLSSKRARLAQLIGLAESLKELLD
jgi:hypothetical protein